MPPLFNTKEEKVYSLYRYKHRLQGTQFTFTWKPVDQVHARFEYGGDLTLITYCRRVDTYYLLKES